MITSNHFSDNGNPIGGTTYGRGFAIGWQSGPLVDSQGERSEPNGAFVEDIIKAALDRLEYYQGTKFANDYNKIAITYLTGALECLHARTHSREKRGVEGSHAE